MNPKIELIITYTNITENVPQAINSLCTTLIILLKESYLTKYIPIIYTPLNVNKYIFVSLNAF